MLHHTVQPAPTQCHQETLPEPALLSQMLLPRCPNGTFAVGSLSPINEDHGVPVWLATYLYFLRFWKWVRGQQVTKLCSTVRAESWRVSDEAGNPITNWASQFISLTLLPLPFLYSRALYSYIYIHCSTWMVNIIGTCHRLLAVPELLCWEKNFIYFSVGQNNV